MQAKTLKTGAEQSAPVFAALGDETRLELVARLCSGGPDSIAHLTAGTDISRQAITKHLDVLARVGLVKGIRQGRERFIRLISNDYSKRVNTWK